MLSSHTACELKRQEWAAFSAAGHKMLLSGCVHVLNPLPPGEALHVWIQPYSKLHCGCHQQSTDGSKPQALLCVWEFNPIHNVKGGTGTSGAALEMLAQANLLVLAAQEEKIPDKQNAESCN